jgi:hypothetical protein
MLDGSSILLLPTGAGYSTVSEATKNIFVDYNFAVIVDKEIVCRWLFNAKTIQLTRTSTDSENPLSDTRTIYACNPNNGSLATSHPFPHNKINETTGAIESSSLHAESLHENWRYDDGTSPPFFMYVFVFNGQWYWSPGVMDSGQSVSALGWSYFERTAPLGDGDYTESATIIETFY